jgi:hypothetical protein
LNVWGSDDPNRGSAGSRGSRATGRRTSWRRTRRVAPAALHGQLQCVKASFRGERRQAPTYLVHRPILCRLTLYQPSVYTEPGPQRSRDQDGSSYPAEATIALFLRWTTDDRSVVDWSGPASAGMHPSLCPAVGARWRQDHRNSGRMRAKRIHSNPTDSSRPGELAQLDRSSGFGEDGSSPRL